VTARGTVSRGVEAGCLVFTPENASDGPWLLIGNTDGLSDGDTVTVRGSHRNDVATTCMQGMPFEVDQVLER